MTREPLAYLDGQFLPQSQAKLPVNDAGFVMGATVTDLCRTFQHRLFRLEDHLRRFRSSCQAAEIPLLYSDLELRIIAEDLIGHNSRLVPAEGDLALVIFATPGPIHYYLGETGGPGDARPTLGMHTFPLPIQRYSPWFAAGVHVAIPETRQIPLQSIDPRIKQRSRLHWWLAGRQAQRSDPHASALLLDPDGYVTETAAANVLIVQRGQVLTPPRDSVLNGVSLQVTEELCREVGIPFTEQRLTVEDCIAADEAMLTGTMFCLAGISRMAGRPLPWPGPVYERLLAMWNRAVGLDIRRQILPDR